MIVRMGVRWNLRRLMADHDMYSTADLMGPLAERGIHLSRQHVHRLVTQTPQRLSMDVLAALCDILGCTPNDLITVEVANAQRRQAAGGGHAAQPAVRRTSIRRPDGA